MVDVKSDYVGIGFTILDQYGGRTEGAAAADIVSQRPAVATDRRGDCSAVSQSFYSSFISQSMKPR